MTKNGVVDSVKVIGAYRLIIDGSMIIAVATMLWTISSWKTSTELSIKMNSAYYADIALRTKALELKHNDMVITPEANRRISVLEATVSKQLTAIEKRLDQIEDKL